LKSSLLQEPSSRKGYGKTWVFPPRLDQEDLPGILPYEKSLQFRFEEASIAGTFQWAFRGQGKAYPTCGTYHTKGCLEHSPKYIKKVKDNCKRAECPICYKSWLRESTQNTVKRINSGAPNKRAKSIHVTISPPKSEYKAFKFKDSYLKIRRKAIRLLKKAGMQGGALIYHPYREIKSKKLWYFSPHFHTAGYGWINSSEVYKSTNLIVKNHRVRKSLGGTVYYQLSHAGVKKGHHVITWYGCLSWKRLRLPKEKADKEKCPICGNILRPVIYRGIGDNPLADTDIKELYTDSIEWEYKS
jgi:hypothetical protein